MTPAALKLLLIHEEKLAAEVSATISKLELADNRQDFFQLVKKRLQLRKINEEIADLQRSL